MDFRTKTSSDLPLVSVVVLSYNYAAYVLDTLDSIYTQTYPHIEFYIVDDCSTDKSVELIRQWIEDNNVNITFIVHPVNKGRNTALNTFLDKAKGKYILTFASDDEMNPRRIEEQVKLMEKAGDEYSVCYSDAELMNEQGEPRGYFSEKVKSPFLSGNVFEEYYFERFFIAAPTIMFRKKIFEKVGFYDQRLTAEDYDMWMRMLPVAKVIFCDYIGTKYRIRENESLTPSRKSNLQQWYHKDRIIIYKKLVNLLEKLQKWPNVQEAASKKISYHLIQLKKLRSPYFNQMISFLLKNAYYKIPVARLLRMQIRQLMPQSKSTVEMENVKKRILVPIVGQGSITHIIRTGMLDKMSEFCQPVIALLWNEEELIKELQSKGYEVISFPHYKVSPEYASLRYKINLWYLRFKLRTPSVNIQQKYLAQFKKNKQSIKIKKQLRDTYHTARFKLHKGYIKRLIGQEEVLMQNEQVYNQYKEWLTSVNISGLFTVTPFLHEVDLIARILKEQNVPVIASIHSFDNVTKRGWQSVVFDHYIVWNKYNKAELQRIHPALRKDEAITIAGAPQFDFHYSAHFTWSREEWLKRLGLPADKKIILYGGGPVSLFPDEPQYLMALKEAFDENKISKDNIVLFRCHPLDKVERWKQYVGESTNIFYDSAPNGTEKLDYVNVLNDDIINLMSTLKYTDVHINAVSTMCVDGSAFHKPQIGPYYDDVNPANQELFRQMYYQEHYVPIMKTNVVHLAHNKASFIDLINRLLENPSAYTANCNHCVEEIITYRDGKSASRAVAAIKNFFTA